MTNWFNVDREGLAKLVERRGKAFVVHELVQNAWDSEAKRVEITLTRGDRARSADLRVVDDDPDGFADIAHAYTLFAESTKKGDAEKRGRFNLGEKLVLALCTEARVVSTSGAVAFNSKGRRKLGVRRKVGSEFSAKLPMTKGELDDVIQAIWRLIPPDGILTTLNGTELERPTPVVVVNELLHTEIADESGILRRTERTTPVRLYDAPAGRGCIYEMGIPVVETGDAYHVDVGQKVPMNMDRDNVLPAYLRDIRRLVLNATAERLTPEVASETWVNEGMADEKITDLAVQDVLTARFGLNRVTADPKDPEATHRAMAQGYTVIPAGSFSKSTWKNVRRAGAALPAGQVTPTHSDKVADAPIMDVEDYTPAMQRVVDYATELARRLMDVPDLRVILRDGPTWTAIATYQRAATPPVLTLNAGNLGASWFEASNRRAINALLIHEFGHQYCSNHLEAGFHNALSGLGAKLAELYLTEPGFPAEFLES